MLTPPVGKRDHSRGPENAPVTLVEYGDYECPYCRQADDVVREIMATMGDRVRYVFRHFPLVELHPHAEHAAEAAESGAAQHRFWPLHEQLYANQDDLDDASLASYADRVGCDPERVLRDVTTEAHAARVQEDVASGRASGVRGTPTVFINGRRHQGEWDVHSLLAAIEEAATLRA
jgi:protein-disulfide isomerase